MIKKCDIKSVITCNKDTSLVKASLMLKDYNEKHIIIVDNNSPVGILSTVDINNKVVANSKDPSKLNVTDVMTNSIQTVDIEDGIEHALAIMIQKNTFSCPVTQSGKLKGIVHYNEIYDKVVKKILEDERK